jgi:hypothetical protein
MGQKDMSEAKHALRCEWYEFERGEKPKGIQWMDEVVRMKLFDV